MRNIMKFALLTALVWLMALANFDSLEAQCPDKLQSPKGLESFLAVLEGRAAFYLESSWDDGEWLFLDDNYISLFSIMYMHGDGSPLVVLLTQPNTSWLALHYQIDSGLIFGYEITESPQFAVEGFARNTPSVWHSFNLYDFQMEMIYRANNHSHIDESIIQAIEDFLYPLYTIFGLDIDSGALVSYKFREGEMAWFNRCGQRIDEPEFVRHQTAPFGFRLYDLEGDGIPEIIIFRGGLGFGGPASASIYRFVDDGYEFSVFLGRMPSFFRCRAGRIIVHHNVDYGGEYGYYALTFNPYGAQREPITGLGWDFEEWDFEEWEAEFADWIRHHMWPYWNLHPTIFRMPEETLTPIIRLSRLENIITDNLRQRHMHATHCVW